MKVKVFKEIVNLFLILTIMVGMMVFFHAFNSFTLWISFFVVIFYGFLGCVMLYRKTRKKILLFVLPIILCIGIMMYFGLVFFRTNPFDVMYLLFIAFIGLQFLIYVLLMGWAFFISKRYQTKHFNRVLSMGLGLLMIVMFLEWTKYFRFRDQMVLALLIFLSGILAVYIIQVILKRRNNYNFVWGINILCVVLYFVINPSHVVQFLVIVSSWIIMICLFLYPSMFAITNNKEIT